MSTSKVRAYTINNEFESPRRRQETKDKRKTITIVLKHTDGVSFVSRGSRNDDSLFRDILSIIIINYVFSFL